MSIPYSIIFNFRYDNDENWSQEAIFEAIVFAFQDVKSNTYKIGENNLEFIEHTSIIKFQYHTEITVEVDSDQILIKTHVKLIELLKIILSQNLCL